MSLLQLFGLSKKSSQGSMLDSRRRGQLRNTRRRLFLEQLDERAVLSSLTGLGGGPNPNETVDTSPSATQLAESLVGAGLSVSNATFTGGAGSTGSFSFNYPAVVGFGQGIVLTSGSAADVVGPNMSDSTSTSYGNLVDFAGPGDADLTALAGYETYDAAVLEFDFVPTANQVVFNYSFASDEYPEWVNTPFNDVFAFFVNGTNYATVRQTAGDPNSPFVPVAVNNINDGNPLDPAFVPARPDLFRPNYVNPTGGPSAIDLELDGITSVLTFQAPVNPGVVNHMKLAIADASDGIYDSAVFIQAGSIVSNENPVADLSMSYTAGSLNVTAIVEGEDPNGAELTYNIDWGDGTFSSGPLDQPSTASEKTALIDHAYAASGEYIVTLTVSNGSLSGTSMEDVLVSGASASPVVTTNPVDTSVQEGDLFSFTAAASGTPVPSVQWQVSVDGGASFTDIPDETGLTYSTAATLADDGNLYQAVFTNTEGSATTSAAMLTVSAVADNIPPDAPGVMLTQDTGSSAADQVTSVGDLTLSGVEAGASVEYSTDGGATWSYNFTAAEGDNNLLVRQTDAAGNVGNATPFSFTLDTVSPVALSVSLASDTGFSSADNITSNGSLAVSGVENGASVEYSTDAGANWSSTFSAIEGLNHVDVRQTDVAGNVSGVASLSFILDSQAPAAPGVSLTNDTGSSVTDKITNVGALTVSPEDSSASVEYSTDGGATWSSGFSAKEGLNDVLVRQSDVAGNVSAAAPLSFNLDTTLPQLHPAFSSTLPLLVGAKGITVSPGATDESGIAAQSSGNVDTATAGQKYVTCTATDVAGNSASVNVPYVVGYTAVNVTPKAGTTFKSTQSIPVTFQLRDANGLISDLTAKSLLSSITVTFDGHIWGGFTYNNKSHTFSFTLKGYKPAPGSYNLAVHVMVGGAEVTAVNIPLKIV
ncbi:MAG: choice-of-anchor L domain-containing protein [Planctomycetales bacterium]|nr:choice-of-anchor L domain-containing protein [Planctomycetales bacterium]